MSDPMAFRIDPLTEKCRSIYERKEHVVFGVSPGNSYFRVPLLAGLLDWLCGEFARVDVVVPDAALAHTYTALGYTAERAAAKVRGEVNVLRNRIARAWEQCGGPRPADGLHMMSGLVHGPVYREALGRCETAVRTDPELTRACRAVSREVLLARRPGAEFGTDQVDEGARYLLAELPFFVAAPEIFEVGSSLCFYHRQFPLAELIYSGSSALKPSPRQAYAIIRPSEARNPAENLPK